MVLNLDPHIRAIDLNLRDLFKDVHHHQVVPDLQGLTLRYHRLTDQDPDLRQAVNPVLNLKQPLPRLLPKVNLPRLKSHTTINGWKPLTFNWSYKPAVIKPSDSCLATSHGFPQIRNTFRHPRHGVVTLWSEVRLVSSAFSRLQLSDSSQITGFFQEADKPQDTYRLDPSFRSSQIFSSKNITSNYLLSTKMDKLNILSRIAMMKQSQLKCKRSWPSQRYRTSSGLVPKARRKRCLSAR